MLENIKYLADNLIMSPDCDRRQLVLSHPDAEELRSKDVTLSAMCKISNNCEVERKDPNVHILIFNLSGKAKLYTPQFPRKGEIFKPRQIAVLPAHQWHRYKMIDKTWKAIWFYLADSKQWINLKKQKAHIRQSMTITELKSAFDGYWLESLRNETRARIAAKHYCQLLVLNLEREMGMEESENNKIMRQKLYALWDTVSANLSKQWTVAALADELQISQQHLYKVCLKFSGHKPMEMVTRLRMQQAKELLISTDQLVKTIAYFLGYADSFSFSSAFKRFYGCSPRTFKNKELEKQIKN